jgi:hypothetical protein
MILAKNFPRFFVGKSRGKELVRKVRQLASLSAASAKGRS